MQVNSVNSNNTAFGARIRVKPKDIDHVMEAIDQRCDLNGVKRIYNALVSGETGKGSKDVVFIKGKKLNHPECGFLEAKVGNYAYTNDLVPTASFWSLPHFFEKIQRLSKEKYTHPLKNTGNRLNELNDQLNIMCDKAFDIGAKRNIAPSAEKDGYLDAIFSIFRQK